jgi:two-component system C4-dicarboxylate transport response regulator DctD
MEQRIILVEDDDALRVATAQMLELAGHHVDAFAGAGAALAVLTADFTGMIVSDIRMPRIDGLQLLVQVRVLDADIPVVLVTGHGDVSMAVKALHDGAADFLVKPFAADHLTATVRRSLAHRALVIENRRLRQLAAGPNLDSQLIGRSPVMQRLRQTIDQLAIANLDVLIEGETGTGKELVAAMLHRRGPRAGRPFVTIDCAALGDTAEIELFGHAADSVAHTWRAHDGHIVRTGGGTLLLDDVDGLPMTLQARLLRVIEEREVLPIGAERPTSLDLHVIATSKIALSDAVIAGRFRADLYYRLAATRLRVPPLRERDDDVIEMFATFAEEARQQFGLPGWTPNMVILEYLRSYEWPGNIRELRSFARQAVLGASQLNEIDPVVADDLPSRVAAFEATAIEAALRAHHGSVPLVLAALKIPRKTLYDKMNRYRLTPSRFKPRAAS